MMAIRAADIVNGEVVNVILVESLPAPELDPLAQGELVECGDEVGIGWSYDGSEFTAPPEVATKPAPAKKK